MQDDIPDEHRANYEQFRDILSSVLVERIAAPSSKRKRRSRRRPRKPAGTGSSPPPPPPPPPPPQDGPEDDAATGAGAGAGAEPSADDLADFTAYIAASVFACLPADLRALTHHAWADDAALRDAYALPLTAARAADLLRTLDPAVPDSLAAYGITAAAGSDADADADADTDLPSAAELLASVLSAYVAAATAAPAAPSSTRARAQEEGCEICGRDWVRLTYHHLIPRMVHDKAVKRGWHRRDELQNVAWLCGACHRFVHHFRGHEELAREYYTVERLLAADEVRRFAEWVGRVRWKAR
ncbi:hypothetical protein VTH06DRAFT_5483 [Thermothelomyces fergusii]